MRRWMLVMAAVLLGVGAAAQEEEILRAACYLSGALSAEEVPAEWVEYLESLHGRRQRVNGTGLRPGLLSAYQIACLADYRASSGDILSWEELALVDGFSREAVAALRPFLSLESHASTADSARLTGQAFVRSTLKNVGGKAKVAYGVWRLGGALRKDGRYEGTYYGEYNGRYGRLLVGHYNLRLGQGLAYWSGFTMESLSTVDAFIRRSPGASPAWSWSPETLCQGAVYEYACGHYSGMVFYKQDKTCGAHLQYLFRHGSIGLTASSVTPSSSASSVTPSRPKAAAEGSVDVRLNLRGTDMAGEAAWRNRSFAGKAALSSRLSDAFRLALQGRVIPSRFSGGKNGEYALATGLSYKASRWQPLAGKTGFGSSVPAHTASLTADLALLPIPGMTGNLFRRTQLRVYAVWNWQAGPRWSLQLRATERYRNYERPRTALRAQLGYAAGFGPESCRQSWSSTLRAESVVCEKNGLLAYWEGGYKNTFCSGFLRATVFRADLWNDRIYVYERDAPGTFSVPAYYGRGGSLACFGSLTWRPHALTLKATLRAACTWRTGHTPSPTLNLHLQCSL